MSGAFEDRRERVSRGMFALAALICFFAALLGGHLGSVNLELLGWVFVAAALLVGPWPLGGFVTRITTRD